MAADAHRPEHRVSHEHASRMMPVAVGLFVIGMIAVAAVFILFALGYTELPLWLSVSAVGFTTIGFALGFMVLFREARGR